MSKKCPTASGLHRSRYAAQKAMYDNASRNGIAGSMYRWSRVPGMAHNATTRRLLRYVYRWLHRVGRQAPVAWMWGTDNKIAYMEMRIGSPGFASAAGARPLRLSLS